MAASAPPRGSPPAHVSQPSRPTHDQQGRLSPAASLPSRFARRPGREPAAWGQDAWDARLPRELILNRVRSLICVVRCLPDRGFRPRVLLGAVEGCAQLAGTPEMEKAPTPDQAIEPSTEERSRADHPVRDLAYDPFFA